MDQMSGVVKQMGTGVESRLRARVRWKKKMQQMYCLDNKKIILDVIIMDLIKPTHVFEIVSSTFFYTLVCC